MSPLILTLKIKYPYPNCDRVWVEFIDESGLSFSTFGEDEELGDIDFEPSLVPRPYRVQYEQTGDSTDQADVRRILQTAVDALELELEWSCDNSNILSVSMLDGKSPKEVLEILLENVR
jgi:hypothetical protein